MSTETPTAAPGAPPSAVSGGRANIALAVVLFAAFMDLLDVTIVNVAAPAIGRDLHASSAQIQWMLAGYTLALGSGLITGGRIGDDHGRRRIFLIGLTGFAVASAACALSPSAGVLIAMRVLQGFAGGLMVPQVFGIIRSSFAPAAMAKAFGAYGAVQGLAAVAGPLLGGILLETDLWDRSWRAIFWVNVPVAAVALVLGARVLPESTAERRARLDMVGAVLSAAAIVLVLLPLVQGHEWGWPWWGWALLAAGVALLAVFALYERRLASSGGQPVFDPGLLRIRTFSAGLAASVFFFGALGSFFLVLSLYLQSGTGRSPWHAGLVVVPYAIGSFLTSGLGVQLAAKAGRALLITGSLVLAASQTTIWLLVRDGGQPGYWPLAGALFIGGLGLGLAAPILVNVVLAGVPGRHAGAAGGVLSTVIQIGGAIGVAVLGTVFFTALTPGPSPATTFGHALATVMPWQIAAYLAAALLMLPLPKTTTPTNH